MSLSQSETTSGFDKNIELEEPRKKTQVQFKKPVQKPKMPKDQKIALIKNIIVSLFLVIFVACVLRIPYFGFYLDTILFDFFFGWTKYFIYIFILLLFISFWNSKLKNILISKKKILIVCFCVIIICLLMNAIQYYVDKIWTVPVKDLFVGSNGFVSCWKNNILDLNNSTVPYKILISPKRFEFGGILGYSFIAICLTAMPVFIVIICLVVLTFVCLFVFSAKTKQKILEKFRNKTIKKLGGFTSEEIKIKEVNKVTDTIDFNEAVENAAQAVQPIPIVQKQQEIEQFTSFIDVNVDYGKNQYLNNIWKNDRTISSRDWLFLPSTKDDYFEVKQNVLKDYRPRIEKFFGLYDLKVEHFETVINYQSVCLHYHCTKEEFNIIKKNSDQLAQLMGTKDVKVYSNVEDEAIIELYLDTQNSISFKEAIHDSKFLSFALFKTSSRKSYKLDLYDAPSVVLYGAKGSGKSVVMTNIITSFSIFNNKFDAINIYDPTNKSLKTFANSSNYITDEASLNKLLDEILHKININEANFVKSKVNNIYEYNTKAKEKIKFSTLILNDIVYDNAYINKLLKIMKYAKKHGIFVLIGFDNVNEYSKVIQELSSYIVCLQVPTEQDSIDAIKIKDAAYCAGNGDAICYNQHDETYTRVQSVYITKNDINKIIELVK